MAAVRTIRIGICEDMPKELEGQKEMVSRIADRMGWSVEIHGFTNGEDLLWEIEKSGDKDILLLDIEMKGMNGVETAREIRKNDIRTCFIFISHYDSYCKEIINVQPFAFIDKPVKEEMLEKVLKRAVMLIPETEECFEYISDRRLCRIPLSQIRYFESNGRLIYLYDKQKQYSFYGKLNQVEETLKNRDAKFIRIHKSYIINMGFVRDFQYEKVIMEEKRELPISKKYRNEVRHTVMKMWRR